jgi:hypothetical protein
MHVKGLIISELLSSPCLFFFSSLLIYVFVSLRFLSLRFLGTQARP